MATAPNFRGVLRFVKFPESYIPDFIKWIKENNLVEIYLEDCRSVHATGGGAYRYADLAMKELGTLLIPHVCPNIAFNQATLLLQKHQNKTTTERAWVCPARADVPPQQHRARDLHVREQEGHVLLLVAGLLCSRTAHVIQQREASRSALIFSVGGQDGVLPVHACDSGIGRECDEGQLARQL